MVDAINRVGHEMCLCTVAEFVENDGILAILRTIGVDYAQGYGISVPMPLDLALAMSHAMGTSSAAVGSPATHLTNSGVFKTYSGSTFAKARQCGSWSNWPTI